MGLVADQDPIVSAASRFNFDVVLLYDQRFRHDAENDLTLRWDWRDTDLYTECFTDQKKQFFVSQGPLSTHKRDTKPAEAWGNVFLIAVMAP